MISLLIRLNPISILSISNHSKLASKNTKRFEARITPNGFPGCHGGIPTDSPLEDGEDWIAMVTDLYLVGFQRGPSPNFKKKCMRQVKLVHVFGGNKFLLFFSQMFSQPFFPNLSWGCGKKNAKHPCMKRPKLNQITSRLLTNRIRAATKSVSASAHLCTLDICGRTPI